MATGGGGPSVGDGDQDPAPQPSPTYKPIRTLQGTDIRPILERAAQEAGIPIELALACAIAESALNERAERWGHETAAAIAAIGAGDLTSLASIIRRAWPDCSFGLAQMIVLYHYLGDRSATVANCLAVRAGVFANPEWDLAEMAAKLASCAAVADVADLSPVDGDVLLGALVAYNAGHYPEPASSWWDVWSANVESYRSALSRARELLAVS